MLHLSHGRRKREPYRGRRTRRRRRRLRAPAFISAGDDFCPFGILFCQPVPLRVLPLCVVLGDDIELFLELCFDGISEVGSWEAVAEELVDAVVQVGWFAGVR